MNDQTDTNGTKTLRDHYPITCALCGRKIGKREPYRITGIRAGTGDKPLAENVYEHRDCDAGATAGK
jgi:hypothetical protein